MSDALNRGAPSADQLRRDLLEMVMRDLHGPAAGPEEEVAERSVRDRYLVGMLAPKHQVIFPEEQDKLETDTGETVDEGTGILADWRKAVVWDREQASIQVSDSHEDFFIRNMVAVLAECRMAFGVIRPSAFCQVDLTAGS